MRRSVRLRGAGLTILMALDCLGVAGCTAMSQNSFDNRDGHGTREIGEITEAMRYSKEEIEQLKIIISQYIILGDPESDVTVMYSAIYKLGEISKKGEDGIGFSRGSMKTVQMLRNIIRSSSAPDILRREAQVALDKMGLTRKIRPREEPEEKSDIDWKREFINAVAIAGRIAAGASVDILPAPSEKKSSDQSGSDVLSADPAMGSNFIETPGADSKFKQPFLHHL